MRPVTDPQIGQVYRYDGGSTALVQIQSPHAGGFHGLQCMGGLIYVSASKLTQPSLEDYQTWFECGEKWRNR